LRHVGRARAPRAAMDGERRARPLPRKARHRVGPILVRRGGTASVTHRDHDLVDARWNADELLIDHALVAAQRLLEALHVHGLVARALAHGARAAPAGDPTVVVR